MSTFNSIIRIVSVAEVDTETGRIKVNLSDNNIDGRVPKQVSEYIKESDWVYPLLPLSIKVLPKVQESVLLIITEPKAKISLKFYVGPIITDPTAMNQSDCDSALEGLVQQESKETANEKEVLPNIEACYPKEEGTSAFYGRKNSEAVFGNNYAALRCNVRDSEPEAKDQTFNTETPSYLLLKGGGGNNSTATLVADKINLIGTKCNATEEKRQTYNAIVANNQQRMAELQEMANKESIGLEQLMYEELPSLGYESFKPGIENDSTTEQKEELISEEHLQNIIDRAHQLPYGDVLVDFMKLFVTAFLNHYHRYPGMVPDINYWNTSLKNASDNLDTTLLSNNVRIN